uniref:SH3 domain-containing protein n=1 Tax=Syphacia muris TaxID=451379 RepID=A0A0N5AI07_9BILA
MSRQPVRVVAKPPTAQPPKQIQEYVPELIKIQKLLKKYLITWNGNSYSDMLRISEQQRRLLEANRREIVERQARGTRVENAAERLATLRNEVSIAGAFILIFVVLREEREMARLTAMQREVREVCAERAAAERQLLGLQSTFSSQEQQLRTAASKVEYLTTQLALLHRQRMSAVTAAMALQRKVTSSHSAQNSSLQSDESSRSVTSNECVVRPRASVEPFQITRPTVVTGNEENRCVNVPPLPPPPVFTVTARSTSAPIHNTRPATTLDNDSADRVVFRIPPTFDRCQREETPSPPKDPYPSPFNAQEQQNISNQPEIKGVYVVCSSSTAKPSSTVTNTDTTYCQTRRNGNLSSFWNDNRIPDNESLLNDIVFVGRPTKEDENKLARADQISIRADTLRAAKRRSWAQQESSVDETEHIRKILCEEQKKGRTHLVLDPHLELILNHSSQQQVEEKHAEVNSTECLTVPVQSDTPVEKSVVLEKASEIDENNTPVEEVVENDVSNNIEEQRWSDAEIEEKTVDTSISSEIDIETLQLIKPPPEKVGLRIVFQFPAQLFVVFMIGILRSANSKKSSRHIVFDPLALLLDAALEGEMDLVKSSAAKMTDLSASNDEGITALHNAICAGQYNIVQFLVESGADVNAQDSDGWTPLHCAASCNNLPMAKLLVESGACVFAQTRSDLETPIEKCEEEENGYDGCQLYLHAAHKWAGVINQRRMFTAYGYEAEHDDELSFDEGSYVTVVDRDTGEENWWLCEYTSQKTGETHRGLAPKNFLSLYPALSNKAADFKHFDLPLEISGIEGEKNNNLFKGDQLNTVIESSVMLSAAS